MLLTDDDDANIRLLAVSMVELLTCEKVVICVAVAVEKILLVSGEKVAVMAGLISSESVVPSIVEDSVVDGISSDCDGSHLEGSDSNSRKLISLMIACRLVIV